MFTSDEYCRTICPLFEDAHEELPPRCFSDCLYNREEHTIQSAPPKTISRRSFIPHFVKRDPREDYHSHPILPWMYGVIDFRGY